MQKSYYVAIGGRFVSAFAVLGDLLKPKGFAACLALLPVAVATLALTAAC